MAKEKAEVEAYTFSGTQLVERTRNRDIITGTISADCGLGSGIPIGSTILVGGKPKTGKTTSVLQYAANAQNQFGCEIYYFNIEGRLDNKVISQIKGIKLDKMHVIMGPPIYDKSGNVIGNRKMSAQHWWDKIGEVISTKPKSVIIVDSVSSLSEEAELAEGMGHFGRGGLQRLEAQFVRQYGDLIMPNNITLFLLAQIQANTSGYGDPLQMKCGNALKHLADGMIFIKNVEKWKVNTEGRILGQDMVWRIECSPLGAPFIDTKVPLRFGEGWDLALDIINNALSWQLIKTGGTGRFVLPFIRSEIENEEGVKTEVSTYIEEFDKDTPGIIKAHGEEACRTWLKGHPEQMDLLDKIIRGKIFG